ncbi:hypothetical protein MJT46_009281 [Ovis ammon polii x Ovis aries]|nr:hypothetical protein MJT46_009281 [Ovis ammon polii x Ovis aries]
MSRIWLKKKSQSVDITAPGFNPLAGAGKQMPQASKPPAPKTPIIEEEQNNAANSQKHPSRRSELKRFYTIDITQTCSAGGRLPAACRPCEYPVVNFVFLHQELIR